MTGDFAYKPIVDGILGQSWCSDCKTLKPGTEFHKATRLYGGLARYCKPCKAARDKISWHNRKDVINYNRRKAKAL